MWKVSSSVDGFEVHGSVYERPIKLKGPKDTLRIELVKSVRVPSYLVCTMDPIEVDAVAGGHYTFEYVCVGDSDDGDSGTEGTGNNDVTNTDNGSQTQNPGDNGSQSQNDNSNKGSGGGTDCTCPPTP